MQICPVTACKRHVCGRHGVMLALVPRMLTFAAALYWWCGDACLHRRRVV